MPDGRGHAGAGPAKMTGTSKHLTDRERLGELGLFSLEKRRLRGILSSPHGDQVVPGARTRGDGNKQKHVKFHLNLRKHFCCEGDRALAQVAQSSGGVSILGDIQKPSGHGPGQPALAGPA